MCISPESPAALVARPGCAISASISSKLPPRPPLDGGAVRPTANSPATNTSDPPRSGAARDLALLTRAFSVPGVAFSVRSSRAMDACPPGGVGHRADRHPWHARSAQRRRHPAHRKRAREQGQVARSADLSGSLVLVAGLLVVSLTAPEIAQAGATSFRAILGQIARPGARRAPPGSRQLDAHRAAHDRGAPCSGCGCLRCSRRRSVAWSRSADGRRRRR